MRQLKISKQITNRESLSFGKYLTEVASKSDIITSEEELELTRRIKNGDIDARNKLCEANLRFVISVAKQYGSQLESLPDLVNEGNIGLIKAAEKFDETRGFRFISYAVWWIRQSIMQYLAENGRTIRLPLNKIGMVNKVKSAKSELEQVYMREPTIDEISEYLMVQEEEKGSKGEPGKYQEEKISDIIHTSLSVSSLDAPLSGEVDSGSIMDTIEGEIENDIKKTLNNKDLQIEIKRVISTLKSREQQVLTLYYGLFDNPAISLEEIGQKFDLTRERVRQIKEKGLRKLKFKAQRTVLKEYR